MMDSPDDKPICFHAIHDGETIRVQIWSGFEDDPERRMIYEAPVSDAQFQTMMNALLGMTDIFMLKEWQISEGMKWQGMVNDG